MKKQCLIWRKPNSAHNPNTPSKYFSLAGTGVLVRVVGKKRGAKYKTILEENMLEAPNHSRLEQEFNFQQDSDAESAAGSTTGCFRSQLICPALPPNPLQPD
uniref:Uncharacterized protein n=1 Tax=Fundulus heteroclitus TaxID=8078 RepID=A0A3Q2QNG1_FUNHE